MMEYFFYPVFGIHLGSWLCIIYMAIKYVFIDITMMMTPEKNRYMRQFMLVSLLVGVVSGVIMLAFWQEQF